MIFGIGTDIVDIKRMKEAVQKEAFLKRVFTEKEISRSGKKPETYAGIFAAKEAFVKAVGVGFKIDPRNVEVLKNDKGKPYFEFFGSAKDFVESKKAAVHLSISHEKDYAVSFVIIEGVEF